MKDAGQALTLMRLLGSRLGEMADETVAGYTAQAAENFTYHDPVDGSISLNQGLRLTTVGGGRIVYRMSGTGTHGTILRIYLEQHAPGPTQFPNSHDDVGTAFAHGTHTSTARKPRYHDTSCRHLTNQKRRWMPI